MSDGRNKGGLNNIRALVIDDDPDDIAGTLKMLSRRGLEYSVASDIAKASEMIRKNEYDLLIVDMRIPPRRNEALILDGGQRLLARLHAGKLGDRARSTPFIVITAQNRSVSRLEIDPEGTCIGVYGKLQHSLILSELSRYGETINSESRGN